MDRPDFFINNVEKNESYAKIRVMMLEEYHSYARQLKVEGNLKQLRFRNAMNEDTITDVRKGLTALINKIEEIFPNATRSSRWIRTRLITSLTRCRVIRLVARADREHSLSKFDA